MHPPKDALSTPGGVNIHTLNPPKCAVAPIAPFIGDHQLPQQLAIVGLFQFGDHEKATIGRFKKGNGSVIQAVEIEAAASGILRDVTAREGDVVPVGQTIAQIFSASEVGATVTAPASAASTGAVPATPVPGGQTQVIR